MFFTFDQINEEYNHIAGYDDADASSDLSDLSPVVLSLLKSYGIEITDEGVRVDTFDAFAKAQALFMRVVNDYDSDKGDATWAELGLSGDDDVDYNGGIPSGVFDAIEAIWKGTNHND